VMRNRSAFPAKWVALPDPTMSVLPNLTQAMTGMNMTNIPRWDNLNKYVKSVISVTFSMGWHSMHGRLSVPQSPAADLPLVFVACLQANINKPRLFIWLSLNLLFTFTGILHFLLQRKSSRPVIIDTAAAAALTTDVSKLLNDEGVRKLNWGKMSYLTKEDSFTAGEKGGSKDRILLKPERGESGFVLARKND
jgi:hypothetical protein